MESVKGGELFNYLDQNELTEQDICKIIKQGPAGNVQRLGEALQELLGGGPVSLRFVSLGDLDQAIA